MSQNVISPPPRESRFPFISGLEGIPAAETVLSRVDGERGRLVVCGLDLADFVARHGFESAASTLWAAAGGGAAPPEHDVRAALGAARAAAFERYRVLEPALDGLGVQQALGLGLASLPASAADPHVTVTGAVPVLLAAILRRAAGLRPVAPDPSARHVEDLLRMLRGTAPEPADVSALSAYLLTVMDHGMNASTFAARVIASTGASVAAAVVGAYAALTGPLHGGAPEPVLEMLEAIGETHRAAEWVEGALARGERLMGFGHRIYRVRDPRADVLKGVLESVAPKGPRLELARAVEAAALDALARAKPGRRIQTNVEFYTALLLDALGIPRAGFTPLFAMGRIVGWTAHALEQRMTGRLIRPSSIYVGEEPESDE